MKKQILPVLSLAVLLAGCDTTSLAPKDQQNGYAALINGVYQETPTTVEAKQIQRPINLAVAQIGEIAPQASFIAQLKKNTYLIRSVAALPLPGEAKPKCSYESSRSNAPTAVEFKKQVESARNLSRDLGAQYLLLVGGGVDTYEAHNPSAVLDVTIIGGGVIPSLKIHADGKASGALVDVETGRILLLANVEKTDTGLTPSYFATDKRNTMVARMREDLLNTLAQEVLAKLEARSTESK